MELVLPLSTITRKHVQIAGGKGASLGEMLSAGIHVPPGFVITSTCFQNFLEETGLLGRIQELICTTSLHDHEALAQTSEEIRGLITEAPVPDVIFEAIDTAFSQLGSDYVAVRSSATAEDGAHASWAGELESYLNTSQEDLHTKIKLCWASLFTPRALLYQATCDPEHTQVQVAIVVQKMIESEVSGIAFSVHPISENTDHMVLEAGYGLGEAIVSGAVTPDTYVVSKSSEELVTEYVGNQSRQLVMGDHGGNIWVEVAEELRSQPKLRPDQIHELAQLILRIERHYGFPCDVEWALQDDSLYVVQSRPITTLHHR